MNYYLYIQKISGWLLTSGLRIAVILAIMLVAFRVSRYASNRVFGTFAKDRDEEYRKRADTLSSLFRYIVRLVILAVASVMILDELGIDIGPILAAAGIMGVAVGFGAQHLVQDIISGFFILIEDQVRVGDVVEISGHAGLVEKINLRMTILRDLSGKVHYIRNGHIDVVTNMTKEFSFYVFDIGVAYRENVDDVIEVMKKVDGELRADPEFADDILEPLEVLGLDEFADSAVIVKARTKTKPIKQWRIGREYKRRLKKRFDEMDIEIPFPHVTLYMGREKDGAAPPVNAT
ncbi:MAG: mechanosensitive ion channel family protein [Candidatus Latescibacteria bacterium]|nr:mechanosensitive ion channel family protein [Candidatus Latescibacterota bacterium]